jgi:signal transduction histidine kinase
VGIIVSSCFQDVYISDNYIDIFIVSFLIIISLLLVSFKSWSTRINIQHLICFYIILLTIFSFFITYTLLIGKESIILKMSGIVCLLSLSIITDKILFLLINIFSVIIVTLINKSLVIQFDVLIAYIIPVIYIILFYPKKFLSISQLHINENKKLQKELKENTKFIQYISHEIKTPLHSFNLVAEDLLESWHGLDEKKKYQCVAIISNNSRRLTNLIANLFDASKILTNQILLNLKKTDLSALTKDIIDECRDLYLNEKKIQIQYNVESSLFATIDSESIKQVLRNIFFNAIKFSPNNSIININLSHFIKKNNMQYAYFIITDEGVGIPEDETETIFKPFAQSSRTRLVITGNGLGLNICKKIIESHKGKIWACNNHNKAGASFHFIIPMEQEI